MVDATLAGDDVSPLVSYGTLDDATEATIPDQINESPLNPPLSNCAFHSKLYERNGATEIVDYEVCTTSSSIFAAVAVLRRCSYILVDCEGLSLGSEGGVLSIISLGTPFFLTDSGGALAFPNLGASSKAIHTTQRIYLIDALSLDESTRAALTALLSLENLVKVVWDGRSDEIELRAMLGVGLTTHVLDLQISEVCGRKAVLCEKNKLRIKRIKERARKAGNTVTKETKPLFKGMHVVLGMDACVEGYMPTAVVRKDSACCSHWLDYLYMCVLAV
jgi:hypothetical protein